MIAAALDPCCAYDEELPLKEARARYFADNGFGPDGGYQKKWERVDVGPIPVLIPNTRGRKRALQYHDLHHVLTGYRTDLAGEFEIAGWELGGGCADVRFAWLINLTGLVGGLFRAPRRTFRAFVRGRRTGNLYTRPFSDALLERRVGEVRRELRLDEEPGPARASDVAAFAAASVAGLALGALYTAPLLAPLVALAVWALA